MGQKASPVGLRLGINKTWESKWFADNKDFSKFLNNDYKIRKCLDKKLKDAAVSSVLIERNSAKTEVIINTAKPGVVIGHGGDEIEKLKKELEKLTGETIQISIKEIKKPDIDAALVAENIAIKNALKAGAKGVKTSVSGRLGGADMARTEGYTEGNVPLHTLRANVDYAHKEANTTYGKIGVKVWIYKGEILPGKEKGGNENGSHSKKN